MDEKRFNSIRNEIAKYKAYIIMSLILLFLILAAYEYYTRYFYILRNPNKIKAIILSYGKYSILAFIILQVLQVIAFFIPGEIVQITGGYIYGTMFGTILSLLGITIGSIIAYGVSRLYGKPLIDRMVSDKQLTFFQRVLNEGSINYIVFLLYLIPGLPKDVLAYICGISSISFKEFIIYSTAGRMPGIFISAYFGAKITTGSSIILVSIAVIMCTLFILGLFEGEKIIKFMVGRKQIENDK